jgi:hypothetical protein
MEDHEGITVKKDDNDSDDSDDHDDHESNCTDDVVVKGTSHLTVKNRSLKATFKASLDRLSGYE